MAEEFTWDAAETPVDLTGIAGQTLGQTQETMEPDAESRASQTDVDQGVQDVLTGEVDVSRSPQDFLSDFPPWFQAGLDFLFAQPESAQREAELDGEQYVPPTPRQEMAGRFASGLRLVDEIIEALAEGPLREWAENKARPMLERASLKLSGALAEEQMDALPPDTGAATEQVAGDADSFNWTAWTDASFVADDASPMEGDVITADSGETIPRSARNLNPFNITAAGNYAWTEDGETFGQIGDDGVFARFDSGARGFRAGFENSSSYDERPNRKVPDSQHDNFSITESHDDDYITLPDGMETMVQWFDVHAPEWKEVNGRKVYENHTKDYYGDFKRTAIALGVEWDKLDSRDPQQQLVLALVVASVEADQAFPFTKKALLDGMEHAKTRRSGRNEPQFKAVYIEELRDDKNFKIDRVDGRVMVTLYGRTTEITKVGTPRGPNWASAYTEDNPHPVPRVAA